MTFQRLAAQYWRRYLFSMSSDRKKQPLRRGVRSSGSPATMGYMTVAGLGTHLIDSDAAPPRTKRGQSDQQTQQTVTSDVKELTAREYTALMRIVTAAQACDEDSGTDITNLRGEALREWIRARQP